jgi:hypothetical protein
VGGVLRALLPAGASGWIIRKGGVSVTSSWLGTICLVAVYLLAVAGPAAGSLAVSIQPPLTCAELGDTVEIAVNASGPDSVGWYYVRVYTDDAILTYLDCSTQILNGCPTGSQCMECGLTGEPGIFSACCACLGTHTCVAAGDLVVMRYVATGEGMSPVLFDGAYVDDCERVRIPLDAVENGVVYVGQSSVIADDESPNASLLRLSCYPNPFSSGVTMDYAFAELDAASEGCRAGISIGIFDCRGHLVKHYKARLQQGDHSIHWDGNGTCGRPVPPGVYFCRITIGGEISTRKLTKVK